MDILNNSHVRSEDGPQVSSSLPLRQLQESRFGCLVQISIVTPTYNRAHLLPNLYSSLEGSTLPPIEWIVVDDGSSDDTEEVVAEIASQSSIQVVYMKRVRNGGMMAAISDGLLLARQPMILVLDSDDQLTPDGLQQLAEACANADDSDIVGAVGLCSLEPLGNIIGDELPQHAGPLTSVEISHRFRVGGDKAWLLSARHLPSNSFAETSDTPGLRSLLTKLSEENLRFTCVNHVVVKKEYLANGITAHETSNGSTVQGALRLARADRHRLIHLLASRQLRRQMGPRGSARALYLVGRLLLKSGTLKLFGDAALHRFDQVGRR